MASTSSTRDEIPFQYLSFIINHVFLPPRLPSRTDENIQDSNAALLKSLRWAAENYRQDMIFSDEDTGSYAGWNAACKLLATMVELETGDALQVKVFCRTMQNLKQGEALAFHVGAQNAGLFIQRTRDCYLFCSFEASPKSSAIMQATGKLVCSYPGPAIAVKEEVVHDGDFMEELASFLEKMKRDALSQASEHGGKAGAVIGEERETAHPKFITAMLTGILRSVAKFSVEGKIKRLQKRIADDIIWENSIVPWRRSPLWLVVRVSLQMILDEGEYKAFMIYFMSRILEAAIKKNEASDTIYFMNSKMSRRVLKSDESLPKFVVERARVVGAKAALRLGERWYQEITNHRRPFVWDPRTLDLRSDVRLIMGRSKAHLIYTKNMAYSSPDRTIFVPKESDRLSLTEWVMPNLNKIKHPATSEQDKEIALADFEVWISSNLSQYLKEHISLPGTGDALLERTVDYLFFAKPHYVRCPEKLSIMILTCMELWISLDKLVTKRCPLLEDYYPMYSPHAFQSLLLSQTCDVTRLKHVEDYLEKRFKNAKFTGIASIYTDNVTSQTFSVRYFDSCEQLKTLEGCILNDAEYQRKNRIAKYEDAIKKYEHLLETARELECQYFTNREEGWTRHHRRCNKCAMIKQAQGMRIESHEWPLPESELERKVVVFETACPLDFSLWRDLTYRLLTDMGYLSPAEMAKVSTQSPKETLESYGGLRKYFKAPIDWKSQKIRWSSHLKSFAKTHYRLVRLTSSRDDICVPHALRYRLHDSERGWWIDGIPSSDLIPVCTFHLPDGPYKKLQYTLRYTNIDPNSIIARQAECPSEISIHEYIAFGSLRAGTRIQWRNILRELKSRTLTFSNESVGMLLMQTVWQAGPPGITAEGRMAHQDLIDRNFSETLVEELNKALTVVEMNWQEAGAVHVYVVIAIRLLTITKWEAIIKGAVGFLRGARRVTLKWARELSRKLPECKQSDMRDSQLRVVQLAAICRSTFNIEDMHLNKLLNSDEDVAVAVECATLIHQNETLMTGNTSLHRFTRALLERDRRLSIAIEENLRKLITSSLVGINLVHIWSAYRGGSGWTAFPKPNDRWVATKTKSGPGNEDQEVHYNLLTGKLLVQGLPLGRMESNYTTHPTYLELFGEKVLDVYPSTMRGMAFQTKATLEGYEVHFAMEGNDRQLIIRTRRASDHTIIHQFIPREILRDDFPIHIIESHHHWFELNKDRLEFRDIDNPWQKKSPPWHIANVLSSSAVMFLGNDENLIEGSSATARMVNSVLGPLEYHKYIDMRHSRGIGTVNVHLPRLKLDFHFNTKSRGLRCRQFPGLLVDDNQDIGAFVGLQNRLVVHVGDTRSVIIPHGAVTVQKSRHHVSVDINTEHAGRVKYHLYTIDSLLGRVYGNGSLLSHLYRCYLHAVTSNCMPDVLTGRTGTEEAIAGLKTAASWSFQKLDPMGAETDLFRSLAALTPTRVFYPPHLQVMQQVTWDPNLSFLSQHDAFYDIVNSVCNHAKRFHIFYEDIAEEDAVYYKSSSDLILLERAAERNSVYTAGCKKGNKGKDLFYHGRDELDKQSKETRVCQVAKLVYEQPSTLKVSTALLKVFEGWRKFKGKWGDEKMPIGYDPHWMGLEGGLRDVFCPLYETLANQESFNRYQLMFLLSTFAFVGTADMDQICTLYMIATHPAFREIPIPTYIEYNLEDGYEPSKDTLARAIKECVVDLEERIELYQEVEDFDAFISVKVVVPAAKKREIELQARELASEFIKQWPCDNLYPPLGNYSHLDTMAALERVEPFFKNWYRNMLFKNFLDDVQAVLDSVYISENLPQDYYFLKLKNEVKDRKYRQIGLKEIFMRPPPIIPKEPKALTTAGSEKVEPNGATGMDTDNDTGEYQLESLLNDFAKQRKEGFHDTYVNGLRQSLNALKREKYLGTRIETKNVTGSQASKYWERCAVYHHQLYNIILNSLRPAKDGAIEEICSNGGLWPQISMSLLLEQLATCGVNTVDLSLEWKELLVHFAKSITYLQRAERMNKSDDQSAEFARELANPGHTNWDPIKRPDWLLMEIENDMLIRPVQADIAKQMISTPGNKNIIVQLLMGEGKTSVVTPIVAAALADKKSLVRVIVLKPLSAQMYQNLVQRLGGLLNRRIFVMPFSRSVQMGIEEAKLVRELFMDCMQTGGVLLAQPEHVQSFKLLGLERLYNTYIKTKKPKKKKNGELVLSDVIDVVDHKYGEVAEVLIDTQHWLDKTSRDILDESDEILNVRHELIYSIGHSTPIQNHPDRWIVIQEVFDLIHNVFNSGGIEINPHEYEVGEMIGGQFPSIRILQEAKGIALLKDIAKKIVTDGLPAINFRFLSPEKRRLAIDFITNVNMDQKQGEVLLQHCGTMDNDISTATLYLLRGLFSHKILYFILKEKRWKVDYGLDLRRTMLAVPYRAKDSPAGRAEFSHPDVAISLTCLSYYYGGLTDEQLETCFRILYKSDNPTMQYERWTKDAILPNKTLRNLTSINLEDAKQWSEIFQIFRFNKSVIDFYLSSVVFPREAKEFKHKLSTSGWDLAGVKTNPTTGFSGTNDNRYLLPNDIMQLDREAQLNTNAQVLAYLLQPKNSYIPIEDDNFERLNFKKLLEIIKAEEEHPVYVLLDVGAQVLELRNDQVAEKWLSESADNIEAAVYFDDNDVLTVITRDGIKEALMISEFTKKLHKCVVYLDEAHTRGTDLRLPDKSRAAVTLGPGLTKDRLVQACMRMRKLGQGHSVLFCAPPEIQRKLRRISGKDSRTNITVRDIIYWTMDQTCITYRKLMPIWAKQGISYQRRFYAQNRHQNASEIFPADLLEGESKTLIEHYGFDRGSTDLVSSWHPSRQSRRAQYALIDAKCATVDCKSYGGASMNEVGEREQQQQRELYHEIECEREDEHPRRAGAAKHYITHSLRYLINTGELPHEHADIFPAFNIFTLTTAPTITGWSQRLLVTSDFARTIIPSSSSARDQDHFLRPVHWLLTSVTNPSFILLVSPFEVNALLSDILYAKQLVQLHSYSARVVADIIPFDLPCTLPVSLTDQLALFAGSLYLDGFRTYQRVLSFLGLYLDNPPDGLADLVGSDGFVERRYRDALAMNRRDSPFDITPILFLRAVVGMRRRGASYLATHLGQILHARRLVMADFPEVDDDEG